MSPLRDDRAWPALRTSSQINQPALQRRDHRLRPIVRVQFRQDGADVILHRAFAQHQLRGNIFTLFRCFKEMAETAVRSPSSLSIGESHARKHSDVDR